MSKAAGELAPLTRLKRGMVGTYQHYGEQHLQRYLAEFDFRMNHRAKLGYMELLEEWQAQEIGQKPKKADTP